MLNKSLLQRAQALKLHGLISHWDDLSDNDWVETLITWEESERLQRGAERRLRSFKPLAQFDWGWPKECDREAIEDFMKLTFIKEATNLILCGPNGTGKSTIACNIAYQSVLQGYSALFTTAAQMLNDLTRQDGDNALQRRIKFYSSPQLLVVDEVGYLSYSNRHADLLFGIISRRYQKNPTVITTNKPFAEWGEIFPNASCVVSLVDRLVHNAEIVAIDADSFRLKEAKERSAARKTERKKSKTKNNEVK
jgi:DNA replication protein DnaC